ncbi:MAG: FecR domain-containing protein [Polyangia bacterium]
MSDLVDRVRRAGGSAEPDWSPERAAANELAVLRRLERRRARRRLVTAALGAACVLLLALVASHALRPRERDVRYADGSRATPTTPDARLTVAIVSRTLVVSQLHVGAYHFEVEPDPQRTFRVVAGTVEIEVLGTQFTVTRRATEVRVEVDSGRVRVACRGTRTELTTGESGAFSLAGEGVASTPPPPAVASDAPDLGSAPPVTGQKRTWLRLAQAGDFDAAYAALARTRDVARGPAELMLASDAARLSHHSPEALPPLRAVVTRYAHDPRAPLAAFTLGRILLDELGRPTEAAEAFARTRTLAPDGPLAEDALAREVEAWSRASDLGRARERAETYLSRYPHGTRARSVRRFSGVE